MFCRPLPRFVILSSGSTLRSRSRIRGTWSCVRSGKQRFGEVGEETSGGGSRKGEARRNRKEAAERREERERKLECARRAKAALEDNPDVLRKGK